MVKSFRDKNLEEQQENAFKDYLSDVERRRTSTPADLYKTSKSNPGLQKHPMSRSLVNFGTGSANSLIGGGL
jgi:hypothetical protein